MTGGNFMSEDHTEPIIYNGTKITSINKGNEAGSLRVEGLKEQRWYYYTLSTWFYFEKQIKNKYPFIDADMLTEAIFLVGSKDRNVTISTAAAIAGVFLGSIYNGPEQLSALDAIRNDFKLKDKKIYEAISGFLNLCTS
jgi:hypothetical protein